MAGLIPYARRRYSPATHMLSMMDDFWSDMWAPNKSLVHDTFKVDVRENDNSYTIEAEMPGIPREEISLALKEGRLTIGVTRSAETNEEKKDYIHRERVHSCVQRSFYLANAAQEGVTARLADGILHIAVPKQAREKRENRIEIE